MAQKEDFEIIIIAGVAKNNVIGNKNQLPWHLKEDLQHFKELTFGNPVIMGRATYLSILEYLGKPLPGRTNIVLTKESDNKPGFIFVDSIPKALETAKKHGEKVYIIGGQSIYQQLMPLADKLEITHIHRGFEGDTFFPEIKADDWLEIKTQDCKGEQFEFSFSTYEKRPSAIKPNKKGMFITFEGIDGSGKSTQIRKLVEHIFNKSKYHNIILTRNPYKNVNIREILHQDQDPYSQAEKLADLYITDRINQTKEIITPNIEKGHFVISDRYKISTIVYQATQGLDMQSLVNKQSILPKPDMTFIVDISAEEAQRRMQNESIEVRGKEHKFEANLEFIKKLRENTHKVKEVLHDEKIFIIDGARSRDEITKEICEIFDKEMENLN